MNSSPHHTTLRYGSTLPIATVDPLTRLWNEASSLVYSRPVAVDAFGVMRGDLADRWELSADRRECKLHARSDVRWHDGEPFRATDLEFTLRLLADPALAERVKPHLPDVTAVTAVGDDVIVSLARPVPELVELLAKACVVPAHRHDAASILADGIGSEPIGTGPYQLVGHDGDTASFATYAGHHHGSPAIGRIEMHHIADDRQRSMAVVDGSIDLTQIKAQDLDLVADAPGVAITPVATRVWRALSLRLDHPVVGRPEVRRAISQLIDRDEIVATALGGYGRAQHWAVPPTSWATPPTPPARGRDAAAATLRAAGWTRGDDGRWLADGAPVTLCFCYLASETFRAEATRVIAAQLDDFGITVAIEPITWEQYEALDRTGLQGTPYAGIVVGWSAGVDPYENLASRYSSTGRYNREGYADAELDELLLAAHAAPTKSAAAEHYRTALEITERDSTMVPLVNPQYLFASRGVVGFEDFEVESFYEFTQYAHLLRLATPDESHTPEDTHP